MVSKRNRQTSMETGRFGSPANLGTLVSSTAPMTAATTLVILPLSTVTFHGMNPPLSATLAPIPLKLERENYTFWRSMVLPSVRAFDLEDFLFGIGACPAKSIPLCFSEGSSTSTVPLQIGSVITQRINPEYLIWMRTDQALMSWLLPSIIESMLGHVLHCTTSSQIWLTLNELAWS